MRIVSCRTLGAAALLGLAGLAPAAQAQDASPSGAPTSGGWVDPPTELAPPSGSAAAAPPAGETAPARSARPEPPPARPAPPVRTAEPEDRPAPRLRPPAARTEPAPQRAARPAEEPRSASRAPESLATGEPRSVSRAPEGLTAGEPRSASRAPESLTAGEPRSAAAPRLPQRGNTGQARAAKQLAIDYLDFWSDRNAVALDAHETFYAPTVRYHGREMSARALQEEKRRFARRWPEREYRLRLDTMRTSCAGAFCTIRSAFEFRAADPVRGRHSAGTGILELGVSFAGGPPAIVSETSSVLRRGGERTVSLEEAED